MNQGAWVLPVSIICVERWPASQGRGYICTLCGPRSAQRQVSAGYMALHLENNLNQFINQALGT